MDDTCCGLMWLSFQALIRVLMGTLGVVAEPGELRRCCEGSMAAARHGERWLANDARYIIRIYSLSKLKH
jgi:hypothetical protein